MIGRAFREDRRRGAIALALALALMAAEFLTEYLGAWPYQQRGSHLVVVLGVVLVMWRLAGRDAETLGLRMRIEPSPRFWLSAVALCALAVAILAAGYLLVSGKYQSLTFNPPDAHTFKWRFPDACIFYPVLEELLYRVILCSVLVAWIGKWPTVFVSGMIFGLVHVMYGVAGPDNFVGGYFLAWAYLRSGSVTVPIAMHSGGNLLVLLVQPRF
jgi:uncharacterized protein